MTVPIHNEDRPMFRPRIGGRGPGRTRNIEKAQHPKQALSRLLPYLIPFKTKVGIVLVFVLLYTLLGLIAPYLMGQAIDRFIAAKDTQGLLRIVVWMLLAYLFNNIFQLISNWIMAGVSQKALRQMRGDLFAHLQVLPIRFFDQNTAGSLMSRLTNDIDAINQAVSQNITSLIASVLSMLGILITMFVLNPWLALASVLVVPILVGFTHFIARFTRKGYRDLQMQLGNLNSVAEEAISGQKVVTAFNRNEAVAKAFHERNQAVFQAGLYANSYALLLTPITNVLGNFFIIVLAGLGGWLALQGFVSIGMIATFITYSRNFIQPMRQLADLYNSIQAALAGAERVFDLMDQVPEPPDLPDARPILSTRGDVRFDHVSFAYEPETPILHDLSLEAQPGQTIALVGPTGAGKTTIINLLTRFYEIQSGSISIDGVDIRQLRKNDLRRQLGLVLQDTFLFADTVMENLRYGRLDATDEECIQAAEFADADHFIRQLPQGYQTNLSERAANLSQGQRQLLAIARAILADPAILILDEATSSVDTRTEARIQNSLLRLMKGRTSFVIAHRLSTIRDADKIIVIQQGCIVEEGTHQSLLQKKGVYHHLYISQFKGQLI